MEYAEILQRLDGVKRVNDSQCMARCPAHDDKNASLAVSQSNGKVLLHCLAGCDTAAIVSALKLEMSDLFPEQKQPSGGAWEKLREHIYSNAQGGTFAKKTVYRKPDGKKAASWALYKDGQYIKGLDGKAAPLYKLPELIDSKDPVVFIPEGEKDVETLQRMELTATTTPDGAGEKWRQEYTPYFDGKRVIILTDNDEAGRKHGQTVAGGVKTVAKSVQIIPTTAMWTDAPEKADISEIAAQFGIDEARKRLMAAAANTPAEDKPKSVFEELGFYEIDQLTDEDKKPPDFIVDGMIPVGMTFLSGSPKIRKSFMALQLAAAVATGSDFLGHKTLKCDVVYFDLEGSKNRISNRTSNMRVSLPNNVFITHRVKEKIGSGLIEKIKQLHDERPSIRLIIIDTYSRARGTIKAGGANAYDSDVQILEPVQQMAIDENIAVVFVHHDKKGAGMVTDTFERLSGTMGISGSADSVLNLVADGKRFDGKAHFEFTPRDARGGELDLYFDESFSEWQILARKEIDVMGNPVTRWCVDNAPDRGTAAEYFKYDDIFKAAYHASSESAGDKVRTAIIENRNELFLECGIAAQTGVRSNGTRGIRLMRVF